MALSFLLTNPQLTEKTIFDGKLLHDKFPVFVDFRGKLELLPKYMEKIIIQGYIRLPIISKILAKSCLKDCIF